MLRPRWYLSDVDWFAHLHTAPSLTDDHQAVIIHLDQMLRVEQSFSPATTVAATHTLLLGVEHLNDAMTHAAGAHDVTEMARLLCGLNLLTAHLTQTVQRIAGHVDNRTFPGLASASEAAVRALIGNLSTAGAAGAIVSGHLKEAHLILRNLTT